MKKKVKKEEKNQIKDVTKCINNLRAYREKIRNWVVLQ